MFMLNCKALLLLLRWDTVKVRVRFCGPKKKERQQALEQHKGE